MYTEIFRKYTLFEYNKILCIFIHMTPHTHDKPETTHRDSRRHRFSCFFFLVSPVFQIFFSYRFQNGHFVEGSKCSSLLFATPFIPHIECYIYFPDTEAIFKWTKWKYTEKKTPGRTQIMRWNYQYLCFATKGTRWRLEITKYWLYMKKWSTDLLFLLN